MTREELIAQDESMRAAPARQGGIMTKNELERLARNHGTGGWQTLDSMIEFGKAILAKADELRAQAEAMNNGAARQVEQSPGEVAPITGTAGSIPAAAPPSVALPMKLWLWKNFVDGRPEYWAFDNPYPIHMDCGDPQTVGEPVGYALVKQSRNGRPEVSEEQILSAIKRATPPDLAAKVARLEDALRGMLELAEYWFMRENRRGYSEEQYKAWYSLGFDSNEFKNARAALARGEA